MDKQPKLLDMSRMRDILAPHFMQLSEDVYFSNELALIHGREQLFQLIWKQRPPFIINDHRMGIIIGGEINVSGSRHNHQPHPVL